MCVGSVASGDSATSQELAVAAAVEARQAGFRKMGAAFKALNEQLKTSAPQAATLTASVQALAELSPHVLRWFPAGSGAGTDALPNVWTDRARFDALANDLVTEVKGLSATLAPDGAPPADLAAVSAQAKRVGAACSTCHRSFRAD